jgi:hypothetical protein
LFVQTLSFIIIFADKVVLEMKPGAQGVVFVVEDVKTHNQFVLKSLIIEETKKEEFEKMIKTWKALCKSKGKNFIVPFVDHFYEGRNTCLYLFILFDS